MKIIGNTVGMGLPKPNLMQTDPSKGDFVYGKEILNNSNVFVAEVRKTTFAEVREAQAQKAVFCFFGEEGQTYPLSSDVGGPICFSIYDPFKKTHDTWKLHSDDSWTWESVPAVSEGGEVSWDCVITTHVRPPLGHWNNVNFSVVSGSLLNVWEKINRGEMPKVLYQRIGTYEEDYFNDFSEAVNVEHLGYGEYEGAAADTPAELYIRFIISGEYVEVFSEGTDITNNTITSYEVKAAEGGTVELDTTLTAQGKAADAKAVGDALNGKLSKSGGTMTGKIVFPTGDQNVGFANSGDIKIFGYGTVNGAMHMRMGDTQYPFQIRGNGERAKYNDSEIALMGDIPTDDHINSLINTALSAIPNAAEVAY